MSPTSSRPTVLVVTRNLPPTIGGMERLILHIIRELNVDYQLIVIGPTNCRQFLPEDISVREIPPSPTITFLLRATLAAVRYGLTNRPSIIFSGNGLTAPCGWLAAKIAGAQSFVYLHGLDIETNHPLYKAFWRPFIRRFDKVLPNSHFTYEAARNAGVPTERMTILHPGTGLSPVDKEAEWSTDFRTRHQLGEVPVLLYLGRITTRKGLLPFIRDALPQVLKKVPNAKLVVIGDEPVQALIRDHGERERAQASLNANGIADHVLFLGEVDDAREISSAYFAADVMVFPIQCRPHDNEGFGMVALEAAAHGVFTVTYRAGGVVDAISEGISGQSVTPGDSAEFAAAVVNAITAPDTLQLRRKRRDFAAQFSWPKFGQRLRKLIAETGA